MPFVDHRITFENWPDVKPYMPGQVIPCLEFLDGRRMGESVEIIKFLAKEHGFYPSDSMDASKADYYIKAWSTVSSKLFTPPFISDEKKEESINEAFSVVTDFIQKHDYVFVKGGWLIGSKMSVADLAIGSIYTNFFTNPVIEYGKPRF